MRKLLLMLCMLCACVFSAVAREDAERRHKIVDTIAVRMIKSPVVSSLIDSQTKDVNFSSGHNRLVVEYAVFRLMSNVLYRNYENLSIGQLENMADMTESGFFRAYTSMEFWQTLMENVVKALSLELGEPSDFTYKINDEKWSKFLHDNEHMLQKVVDEAKNKMEEKFLSDLKLRQNPLFKSAFVNVIEAIPVLLIKTVMAYFSYDEFVADYALYGEMAGIEQESDIMSEPSDVQIQAEMGKILQDENLRSKLIDYVALSRGIPYFKLRKYFPVLDISDKKTTYSGQTYCGQPYGKGALTDKKGVRYVGNFKNGVRHGLIMMQKPGESPVPQVWFKGQLKKTIPAGPSADGTIPDVALCDGMRFGYGRAYDAASGILSEGFFIDGQLNGKGKMTSPGFVMVGQFENGILSNGVINWKGGKWKLNEFRGLCHTEHVREGVSRLMAADGTRQSESRGLFIDGMLEGNGTVMHKTEKDTVFMKGIFACGMLCGQGQIDYAAAPDKNGIRERSCYKGSIFEDMAHGKGCVEIILSDIPEGTWWFERFGVKVDGVEGGGDVSIRIEGDFDDGTLMEGSVTVSNGNYMTGRFAEGKLVEGRMSKRYSDGSSYDGECVDGKFNGYGNITYPDGTVYEGIFKDGVPVGMDRNYVPRSELANLEKDTRTFRFDNLSNKKGVASLIRAAGVKVIVREMPSVEVTCAGRFKDDVMTAGKVTVSDGTWMEGSFEDGVLISGRGRTIDKYGTVYVGDIRNGFPHGNGKCKYKDGTWFEGNFANGNRMGGTHYSADGKIIRVYK